MSFAKHIGIQLRLITIISYIQIHSCTLQLAAHQFSSAQCSDRVLVESRTGIRKTERKHSQSYRAAAKPRYNSIPTAIIVANLFPSISTPLTSSLSISVSLSLLTFSGVTAAALEEPCVQALYQGCNHLHIPFRKTKTRKDPVSLVGLRDHRHTAVRDRPVPLVIFQPCKTSRSKPMETRDFIDYDAAFNQLQKASTSQASFSEAFHSIMRASVLGGDGLGDISIQTWCTSFPAFNRAEAREKSPYAL